MKKFMIASVRGKDFEIEGTDFANAWQNLCEREKDNGSLWKAMDSHRVKAAVERCGFTFFDGIAIKEIK